MGSGFGSSGNRSAADTSGSLSSVSMWEKRLEPVNWTGSFTTCSCRYAARMWRQSWFPAGVGTFLIVAYQKVARAGVCAK